jgi:hypothetical protein
VREGGSAEEVKMEVRQVRAEKREKKKESDDGMVI